MLVTITPFIGVQYTCIWAKQIILGASSLNHGAMSRPNDMFEYQFMYITYWLSQDYAI